MKEDNRGFDRVFLSSKSWPRLCGVWVWVWAWFPTRYWKWRLWCKDSRKNYVLQILRGFFLGKGGGVRGKPSPKTQPHATSVRHLGPGKCSCINRERPWGQALHNGHNTLVWRCYTVKIIKVNLITEMSQLTTNEWSLKMTCNGNDQKTLLIPKWVGVRKDLSVLTQEIW